VLGVAGVFRVTFVTASRSEPENKANAHNKKRIRPLIADAELIRTLFIADLERATRLRIRILGCHR